MSHVWLVLSSVLIDLLFSTMSADEVCQDERFLRISLLPLEVLTRVILCSCRLMCLLTFQSLYLLLILFLIILGCGSYGCR